MALFRKENLLWLLCIILLAIIYMLGLKIHLVDVDATQYASIALEMLQSGEYLQVKHQGNNYLDKPPLVFWLAALSFKIFGVSTWAYKLPSVLFTLLSFYAVYRFCRLIYNENIALLSAFILATSQAYFLFNHDIRTDTLLAASVVFSLWLLQEYRVTGKWIYFFGAFASIALAMLSKGPIGLMVPVIAFSFDFLWHRQWKMFFKWQWLLGLIITLLLLSPMLYGLYKQYGFYGWKFFFWLQSFGRITGENVWKNDDSPSAFFVHTLLWTFAPWSLLLIGALVQKARQIFSAKNRATEIMTFTGIIIPIIVLSFSHYKLPHYIFVVYGLAAVITANYIYSLNKKWLRFWQWASGILSALIIVLSGVILFFVFPSVKIFPVVLWLAGLTGFILSIFKTEGIKKLMLLTGFGVITVNLVLNSSFYPQLLKYQSATEAAIYLNQHNIPDEKTAYYKLGSHAFNFHRERIVPVCYTIIDVDKILQAEKYLWVFTDETGFGELSNSALKVTKTVKFQEFPVAFLNIKFLNPATRPEVLSHRYLVKVEK